MKLQPELILLRWMNYHLQRGEYPKKVTNFTTDLQDSNAYSILLHQLRPDVCRLVHGKFECVEYTMSVYGWYRWLICVLYCM